MKRVHQIIYQETISPTIIALVVLSFVVFTREFGRLAELLIQKNAEPAAILQVVLYLVPSILEDQEDKRGIGRKRGSALKMNLAFNRGSVRSHLLQPDGSQ